ncbi:MAG: hypothetical protein GTN93_10625, partial [Anaerolineae bacterium]|nr:hypothetical protein [Anaerolineae bacterium]
SQNPRAWFEYIARLSCGEIERDYQKEASFDGRHFWTLEETVAETEKMAKQLAALKEER